jgi:hypothetical protein
MRYRVLDAHGKTCCANDHLNTSATTAVLAFSRRRRHHRLAQLRAPFFGLRH